MAKNIGAWVVGLIAATGAGLGVYRLARGRWPWSKAPQLPAGEMPPSASPTDAPAMMSLSPVVTHMYTASELRRDQYQAVQGAGGPMWTASDGKGALPLSAEVKAAVPAGTLAAIWGPMTLGPDTTGYMAEVVTGSSSRFYLLHPRDFQLAV